MRTILIVDHRATSRHLLASVLKEAGHVVIEAFDGAEALQSLRDQQAELIICDVLLPGMDGYELVAELRADPVTAAVPVIFCVSAFYARLAKLGAAECGVQHVITKSAEPATILEAVQAALSKAPPVHLPSIAVEVASDPLVAATEFIDANAQVFIVDDDRAMTRLLSAVISGNQLKVVVYSSPEEFLENYHDDPGCLILDLQMPGMSGIALLQSLRARRMEIPAIILTGRGDINSACLALRLHALDFLEKTVHHRTLLARVYYALQEDSIRRHRLTEVLSIRKRMMELTQREQELVELLMEGRSSKEIAAKLHISVRTVGNHRTHMMAKTGATNVADLVRMNMIAME